MAITDLERLLKQAHPDDQASLDALVSGLARTGHLGRRRGTRLECQMGAVVWIPADSPYLLTGGPSALLVTLPALERPVEVLMGVEGGELAKRRLTEALERLEPVVTWRELLQERT